MNDPCDWDAESYCVEDGCPNPATHNRLDSMAGELPVYEMVCCEHASPDQTPTYWTVINAELVEQDGKALVAFLPYIVTKLTRMATDDGHRLDQLKWNAYRVDGDPPHDVPPMYRLIARALPVVRH